MADRSVSVPMTLSDLERQDARVKLFRRISLITLVPMGIGRWSDLQMGADCRPNKWPKTTMWQCVGSSPPHGIEVNF